MAVNIKWDISYMTQLARKLSSEKEIIEKNKEFLKSINSEVEKAWQGYAGRAFDQRMDIDVENLEKVIKGIDSLINDLNNVIKNCYEACENDIQSEINSLRSKI